MIRVPQITFPKEREHLSRKVQQSRARLLPGHFRFSALLLREYHFLRKGPSHQPQGSRSKSHEGPGPASSPGLTLLQQAHKHTRNTHSVLHKEDPGSWHSLHSCGVQSKGKLLSSFYGHGPLASFCK
jgi:hypothetical protein